MRISGPCILRVYKIRNIMKINNYTHIQHSKCCMISPSAWGRYLSLPSRVGKGTPVRAE